MLSLNDDDELEFNILLKPYFPNILEMSPEEEELLRHILIDVKYGKKCFVVLNHETFANIPITIVKFMQVAHEM